jgi:hypothetical protein
MSNQSPRCGTCGKFTVMSPIISFRHSMIFMGLQIAVLAAAVKLESLSACAKQAQAVAHEATGFLLCSGKCLHFLL